MTANLRLTGIAVTCAIVLVACGRSEAPTVAPASAQVDSATVAPVSWLDSFTLGTEEDPFRGITQDPPKFRNGERVQLRMNATNAPAEVSVRVEWVDGGGTTVGEEEITPVQGQNRLTFLAPLNLTSDPGQYSVRVELQGREVYEDAFEVVVANATAAAEGPPSSAEAR